MVSIESYSSGAPNSNCMRVQVGKLYLYFSYTTIVAFSMDSKTVGCENNWGSTTGKHLNWIEPDKKKRIGEDTFETLLTKVLKKHNLL